MGRHQEPSHPFIHSRKGLFIIYSPWPLTWSISVWSTPLSLPGTREKSESSRLLVFGYEVFEERAGPQKSFSWCRGGHAWGLAYMWGVNPHSSWNNTHTHTHTRGPYILLSFLCVSGKSRHTQFTDSILRRSSTVGRLLVPKLNFITPGRRPWQTHILYKPVVKDDSQSGRKQAFVFVGLSGPFMDGWTIFLSLVSESTSAISLIFANQPVMNTSFLKANNGTHKAGARLARQLILTRRKPLNWPHPGIPSTPPLLMSPQRGGMMMWRKKRDNRNSFHDSTDMSGCINF